MSDFLLEILSEEIPAKMQKNAAQIFAEIAFETLLKAGILLKTQQVKTFVAPRRIALYIESLEEKQIINAVKKVGPKTSADKKAIDGFLRANGLKNINELQIVEHNKIACYSLQKPASETYTAQILQENLPNILQKMVLSWPKIMRFDVAHSSEQPKWIRPIRNICCLFGSEIISIKFAGLKSNNLTFGHFLYSREALQIKAANEYKNLLRENFVIVDQDERKKKIIAQIHKIKNEHNLSTIDDEDKSALYDEVVGLCEWPTALIGEIDKKFMSLPEDVLILTLKLNQKYFCLRDNKHNLSTKFIFISNAPLATNNYEKIISDNEKVVRARLSDAKFFVEEDLKTPLISNLLQLKNVVFHQKLGSIFDRVERIEAIAELLSLWIAHCDISLIEEATNLCKADLVTKTVAELPELQGKIGSFYAKSQGKNNKVSTAIYEHYLPLGPNSELPKTPLGIALAIADKIDTIVGLFLADEKPTSSKDPFALRRLALGVIRTSFTYNINLPLRVLIEKSIKTYKPKLLEKLLEEQNSNRQKLVEEILKFFLDRLKNFLRDYQEIRKDVLNATIDEYIQNLEEHKYCDILILAKRVEFLNNLVQNQENVGIIKAYKRSANVLAIEEKRDGKKYSGKASNLRLKTKYDKSLKQLIQKITPDFKSSIVKGDFEKAFKLLRLIENPLNLFFENVIINDKSKKLRENRLILLSQVKDLFSDVADFSQIEI